ncbi:MAG: RNA polymerase sigma factor [Flavobacteriaceae bacterium]|nr:RNA polymerase sigma factor [Flavobacteriaceae bacterium]
MTNDLDSIEKIIKGDTHSFALLLEKYKDMVFTLTFRMLKNREEAEEVAQDTFIKAYKSLNKFKGDSKFSTWLYRIAYNTSLDKIKKLKKEQLTVAIDEYTEGQVRAVENALDNLERAEQRKMIQDCIQQLPPDSAALLTLYYFDGLSLDEIAKVLNIKASNVKVKLFRSRKKLTHILKERIEPEMIRYGA